MCGIVGYIGNQQATPIILEGLKKLEYRGYDSAGICTIVNGSAVMARSQGKLINLERLLAATPLPGSIGIGHTRWATHGKPSEINAHPHKAGSIIVVHNGIIENYLPSESPAAEHRPCFQVRDRHRSHLPSCGRRA